MTSEDKANDFQTIISSALRDTVNEFIRNPHQFHGDTGIKNFLYHRLMTHGGDRRIDD